MTRRRIAGLFAGLAAAGAGCSALYFTGSLGAAAALRLGSGLSAGLVLVAVLPVLWPAGVRPGPSALEEALDSPPPASPERPRSLRDTELAVRLACSRDGAYDLHYRLRPLLRRLAEHRLRSRRLVDLDRDEKAAREILGPDLWELVQAGAPPPGDRPGRGVAVARLARWVEKLESL